MKRFLVLAASLGILLSSCRFMGGHRVRGDGNVVTQTRTATNFSSVDVSSAFQVILTQDSSYSVKVEVDNNLQEFVDVFKEGETLHIKTKDNVNLDPTQDAKIYISAPSYKKLEVSGACGLKTQNKINSAEPIAIGMSGSCSGDLDIKAPKITTDMAGSCDLTLRGETKDLAIDGAGSIDVKAFGLLAENVDIDLSGSGSVEVTASVKIQASGAGSTDIRYKGSASVSSDMSGSAGIKKVE